MKRCEQGKFIMLIVCWLGGTIVVRGGVSQGIVDDYRRAVNYLPWIIDSLVLNESIRVSWIDGSSFWYRREVGNGKWRYVLVDIPYRRKGEAFDHKKLAIALSQLGERVDSLKMPIEELKFSNRKDSIYFRIGNKHVRCSIMIYKCENYLIKNRVISSNGIWNLFVKDNNLYAEVVSTEEILQLTDDATADVYYAMPQPNPLDLINSQYADISGEQIPVRVRWAPDGKRFVTYRLDQRQARRLTMVQYAPSNQLKPRFIRYIYPFAGDWVVTVAELYIFDLEKRTKVRIEIPPIPLLYYGGTSLPIWDNKGENLFLSVSTRGYKSWIIYKIDAVSGQAEVVYKEESESYVNPIINEFRVIGNDSLLLISERDGWSHIYLLDLKNYKLTQLTKGSWNVREIIYVDHKDRVIYFTAIGKEKGDPYLHYLYRTNFDGSKLELLTPEEGDHDIQFSPNGEYFIDTYSLANTPPISFVKDKNGRVIMDLEMCNIETLQKLNWKPPQPFSVKAADGVTDLYGLMWFPSTFDSTKKYPLIEQLYTGPQGFFTPKNFVRAIRTPAQSIAELGFIVIQVDGRGTDGRGKSFRLFSYRNLGGVLVDHVETIKQLAQRFRFIDIEKVGVYGHSAGGYDAAHALLAYPDFYKVGVASAGNHDHRLDKAWWNELWMGFPPDSVYDKHSNVTLAPRLKGKLLLVHGDIDENVPLAATMRLVDELIKHNKNFDMLIIPNASHGGLARHPYFIRKRWNYFVKHLLGKEPPENFDINAYINLN